MHEFNPKILVINPGSTSTKIAVFEGETCLFTKTIRHFIDDLIHYDSIIEQYEFRKDIILGTLELEKVDLSGISIIMGRGGLTYPLKSGIYEVDDRMLTHVRKGVWGQHASNLGPVLAHSIAKEITGAKAFIADPVVTDELEAVARFSGHPRFERRSIFHALNQKAVARLYARSINRKYNDLNLIVVHMGGGVSVGIHSGGKVIDVNNALDGEGPFSPERSGTLPVGQLIECCYCGNFTEDEIRRMVVGEGGITAYLNTNSMMDVEEAVQAGNTEYIKILDAFVYQVAKAIGEMSTVVNGSVDAIILTGGIAQSTIITDKIKEKVGFISQIVIRPGEDEMEAMALNACLMLKGELEVQKYPH
ncbi:MAG: butyrate kinase [Prolixibacteraceae bacterium]|jgi:butyrate kinase|nr:butyrate kinase [Prolixibacteraceae bacterium]